MFFALALAATPAADPDPPPAGDWYRFPPACVCRAALDANDRLRANLGGERLVWPPGWQPVFQATLDEAQALRTPWFLLNEAQHELYDFDRRRARLADLRAALGREAYDRGEMPPALPHWRFREVR